MLCSVLVNINQQKKVINNFSKYLKILYSQIYILLKFFFILLDWHPGLGGGGYPDLSGPTNKVFPDMSSAKMKLSQFSLLVYGYVHSALC